MNRRPQPARVIDTPDGHPVGLAEYGDPGGVPTVFFHGWPGSRLQGLYADEAATDAGVRVIAVDRPGYGATPPRPGSSLTAWADTVGTVADTLNLDRFHVLGLSGGGPSAYACAHRMPDRVQGVFLLCPAPPFTEAGGTRRLMPAFRALLAVRRKSDRTARFVIRIGAAFILRFPAAWQPRLCLPLLPRADRRLLVRKPVARQLIESVREGIRAHPAVILEDADTFLAPWGFSVRGIRQPVHIWHGTDDRTVPHAYSEDVARLLPNAALHSIPGEGHYSLPWNHSADVCREIARCPL
ncbi:MAG: alpha/beta hydrolase [Opitutales bacterium]|nr:alpha/beta hydrolase [Opitutales bacterium]